MVDTIKLSIAFMVAIFSLFITLYAIATPPDNQQSQIEQKKVSPAYSRSELQALFKDVKERSFTDISETTELIFEDMYALGYASPFSLNVFIDINRINSYQWPRDALVGLFSHELAHMVSYHRRSLLDRISFIWNYYFSKAARRKVEHEADRIAIERGYGEELVLIRTLAIRDYGEERVERMRGVYYWPETLESIISSIQ